ncbi:MAG: hypothetical protein ACRDTK_00225 [Mycobacterium sp.]
MDRFAADNKIAVLRFGTGDRTALASDQPPRYERAPVESTIEAAEPRIRALLRLIRRCRRDGDC